MKRRTRHGRFRLSIATALALATAACAPVRVTAPPPTISTLEDAPAPSAEPSAPAADPALAPGHRAAARAISLVGVPYRFGGTSPELGFDCSGLVQHAYAHADTPLPRDSREQRLATAQVKVDDLDIGDLLFYRRGRGQSLHVALYVGHGLFVHAPSRGGAVRVESVTAPHWKRRFIEARRPITPWSAGPVAAR
ncbi:MAG: C40 family peptidase [Burkholderiales bacterium]